MQHDVCSLEVMLPEIGLNTSVLVWPNGPEGLPVPDPQLELADQITKRIVFLFFSFLGEATAINERLVAMAVDNFPNTSGKKYSMARHVNRFLALIPRDCSTFDIQPMLKKLVRMVFHARSVTFDRGF